jgi:hypothetical protein
MKSKDPFFLVKEKQEKIFQERLGEKNLLCLEIHEFKTEEILSKERTIVNSRCSLHSKNYFHDFAFVYEGDGFLDSFVWGVIISLSEEFPSLSKIKFKGFKVLAHLNDYKQESNAEVEVELIVSNSYGKNLIFQSSSKSLIAASLKVVKGAIEHLTNCERTVTLLKECIRDSDSRFRMDLKAKYMSELMDLVQLTSYEDII